MITIQRKMMAKIRTSAVEEGNGPKNITPGKYYPVMACGVGMRKAKNSENQYEEITTMYIINDKGYLSWAYTGDLDLVCDWEGNKPNGEAGQK